MRGQSGDLRVLACATGALSRRRASQAGSSLLEVMIAGAIATVLGLGVSTMVSNMQRGVISVQRKDDFVELQKLIMMTARTTANCNTLFSGNAAPVTGDTWVVNAAGSSDIANITIENGATDLVISDTVAANRTYGSGIYINSLNVTWPGVSLGGSTWRGTLDIVVDRYDTTKPGAIVPGGRLSASIPISFIDGNSDGKANSCTVGSTVEETPRAEIVVAPAGVNTSSADYVGSTCDAIHDAIAAAATSPIARGVYIKAGTYNGSCTGIDVPANITIRGAGDTTIINSNVAGAMTPIFNITGSGVTIKDLALNLSTATISDTGGIMSTDASYITLKGISFTSTTAGQYTYPVAAVTTGFTSIAHHSYTNLRFGGIGAAFDPFYADKLFVIGGSGSIYHLTISNNVASAQYSAGGDSAAMSISPTMTSVFIENNFFRTSTIAGTGAEIGISLTSYGGPSKNVVIANNSLWANDRGSGSSAGIRIILPDASARSYDGLIIKGNTITSSGADTGGVRSNALVTMTNAVIADNDITCSGSTTARGIYAVGPMLQAVIRGNRINACTSGIDITGNAGFLIADGARIEGNNIRTANVGVNLNAMDGAVIAHNHFFQNRIGVTGTSTSWSASIHDNNFDLGTVVAPDQTCDSITTADNIGICMNSSNWHINNNQFYATGSTVDDFAIIAAAASAGAMIAGNTYTNVDTGNECRNCAGKFLVGQNDDASVDYYNTNLNLPGTSGISNSGTGNVTMSGGGDIDLTHTNSDINLTGANSDIIVSGGGGVNVGTGAAVANKVSKNGTAYAYYNCKSVIACKGAIVGACPAPAAPIVDGTTSVTINAACGGSRVPINCMANCVGTAAADGVAAVVYSSPDFFATSCQVTCRAFTPTDTYNSWDTLYARAICCEVDESP